MIECYYCHREIAIVGSGHWAHVYRTEGRVEVSHLNRCQSDEVPYGQDATPDGAIVQGDASSLHVSDVRTTS